MLNQFSRTELLYGKEAMERLANARVAIFGLGGVGGYTAEALARSGVGTFDLIDDDKVCLTNLNRQIIATRKTVGKQKVEVMRDRILEINPHARIHLHNCFYLPDQREYLLSPQWEPETRFIRNCLKWQIFTRHPSARWQKSCGGN